MKKAVISILLFVSGIFLSCIYFLNSDINPNIISYNHSVGSVIQDGGGIRGEFTAPSNYLGLLTIRFDNKEIIEKKSLFRIKEKSSDSWYHTSSIEAIQYNIKPLYAFGLPSIADSKNKTYEFEISLPNYVPSDSGLTLSTYQPIITSHYVIPWKMLGEDKYTLFNFLKQKISYQLQSPYAPWVFFAYFLPLIGYLLYKSPSAINVKPITAIALIGIGFDVFVLKNNYDILALVLSLAWIGGILIQKVKPQTSILIALALIIWCPFFLVAHMEWVAEKAANWMFILTTIGFFQYCFKSENIRNNDI